MIMSPLTMLIANTGSAEGMEMQLPPDTNGIMVNSSSINVTIGDSFFTPIEIRVNRSIDNVTINNITFDNPNAGIINFSGVNLMGSLPGELFDGGSWWTPLNGTNTIDNVSGYAFNLTWINDTAVNNTNCTFANISWYAFDVGITCINLTVSTKNNTGVISYDSWMENATVIVHPEGPTDFTAETYNSTQINLTFPFDCGMDEIRVRRKTNGYPTNIADGDKVYNGTATTFEDTGLTPNTRYNYTAWGYNSTRNLYSIGVNIKTVSNITDPVGGGLPSTNTTIRGYVNDSMEQTISGVIVNASNQTFMWSTDNTTNDSGYYELNIFEGNFSISFIKAGYNDTYYNASFPVNDTCWVNVTMNSSGNPPSNGNSSISGYVLFQSNDSAIPDAMVVLYDNATSNPVDSELTDGSGYYNFSNLTNGIYDIGASKSEVFPEINNTNVEVPDNDSHLINQNFSVDVGGEPEPGQSGNSNISGFVFNQDNNSVAGITVQIEQMDGDYIDETDTISGGYYNFTGLAPGNYSLVACQGGSCDTFPHCGNPIRVNESEEIENVNFTISFSGFGSINFSGTVMLDRFEGVMIPGVNVSVVTNSHPYDDVLGYTFTDDQGQFEMSFTPNSSAVFSGIWDVKIILSKPGYYMTQDGGVRSIDDDMWNEEQWFFLAKEWETNALVRGCVKDNNSNPLGGVRIEVENDAYYFSNETESNQTTGNFTLGVFVNDSYPNEFWIESRKEGYFVNETDFELNDSETKWINITLEQKPPENAYITGYVNCSTTNQPMANIELMLIDPDHPFEGGKEDMPRTNETGFFNISTYAGSFYLVTLAKMIGERRDGPPLAIGGYVNNISSISVEANSTNSTDVEISVSDPDVFESQITFTDWNRTVINMSRTVKGNAELIRFMNDYDMDGIISANEIEDLESMINQTLNSGSVFDMEAFMLYLPFDFEVDEKGYQSISANIEFSGLEGLRDSNESFTLYVNNSIMVGNVSNSAAYHSMDLCGYYENPAFNTSYEIHYPNGYTVKDAHTALVDFNGMDTSDITFIPHQDPNWNDTYFYENVYMFVGNSSVTPFASINENYHYNGTVDSDGDGTYDFLMKKIKFTPDQSGDYEINAILRSSTGETITSWNDEDTYSTSEQLIQFSFDGEQIYRKGIDGPYTVIIDLFSTQDEDSRVWLDSITQQTPDYQYDQFDQPPIFFTGTVTDYGQDSDGNGLYDNLIFEVQVDVGETGDYIFEGDIGIASFNPSGDPYITRSEETITFYEDGLTNVTMSFDGTLINAKRDNASIWCFMQVRKRTTGERMDELGDYMTDKYYYDEFEEAPPENCIVLGSVRDLYGQPISGDIQLEDVTFWQSNGTALTDGNYSINARPGSYRLRVNSYDPGYDWYEELIIFSAENQTIYRNITLLPEWSQSGGLCWDMQNYQYSAGEDIYLNVSTNNCGGSMIPNANATVTIYQEFENDNEYLGRKFITENNTNTDGNGEAHFVINTTGFTSGWYNFGIVICNKTTQTVSRGDVWGLQISSLSLEFELGKNKYRVGDTVNFTYNLTYNTNNTCVNDSDFTWKVLYWDWTEHVIASGSFNDSDGHGYHTFTVPSSCQDGQWYEIQLKGITPSDEEVVSWNNFGITSGSVINSVEEYKPATGDRLQFNVSINVTSAAEYRIESGLHDSSNNFICWNETIQDCSAQDQTLYLVFDGEEIQASEKDGPYEAWIGLFRTGDWEELDSMDYTTEAYSYNDFATPSIRFNKTRGISYEKNGTENNYDALLVNCTINASELGNYSIHANLHKRTYYGDWWESEPVAWNCTSIEIDETNNETDVNVTLRFEGSEIYNSGQMGPYYINFNLHQGTCEEGGNWITFFDAYEDDSSNIINVDYTEFSKPSAYIENLTIEKTDDDLIVRVDMNVSNGNTGWYYINGDLQTANDYQWISWANNDSNIESEGTTRVNLTFSGEQIYSKEEDGPYAVYVNFNGPSGVFGYTENQSFGSDWNYTDFSTPSARFLGTHSDQGYDNDGDGYYDGIRITIPVNYTESGNYEVSGELYQESGYNWNFITWTYKDLSGKIGNTEENVTVEFNGNEIVNSGLEGEYGVNLWLRDIDSGSDLGNIEFTTDTSYDLDEFSQPDVRFSDNSPTGDGLNDDGSQLNISVDIEASEIGSYTIKGDLHKVSYQNGYEQWYWITFAETSVDITSTGTTSVNLSFETGLIKSSGYDGPYSVHMELMDENWNPVDFIDNYETSSYTLDQFSTSPANFTGDYDDYLYPTTGDPTAVKLNLTLNVTETGWYEIQGDLHKNEGWNWNFIAGSNKVVNLDSDPKNVTLTFDAVEILNNLDGMSGFEEGSFNHFDIDVWLRRSDDWTDLDHKSFTSKHTYGMSNFTGALEAEIEALYDNGYNQTANDESSNPYDYLNITATVNFTQSGNYELWCDLGKDDGYNWHWIGWKNTFETITENQVSDGYEEKNVTLRFKGERISSSEQNGPYNFHMELRNMDTGSRVDMYDGQTSSYNYDDFVGSSVAFVDDTETAIGVDSDDAGSEYDVLQVSVNVTSDQSYNNVELRGDLLKQVNNGPDQWISWKNNWISISSGTSQLSLNFSGEIIRNSELDGPYQSRIELWNMDDGSMLDTMEGIESPSYSYDLFQTAAASFNQSAFSDWGNDTGSDGYDTLDINVTIDCSNAGNYRIWADLFSDSNGWNWLGYSDMEYYLSSGENEIILQFDGTRIRNQDIDGTYKARIELRKDGNILDTVDPYTTSSYTANDFEQAGAEIVSVDEWKTSSDDLQINVTVNASSDGTYWIGGDLHKELGWNWEWISWKNNETTINANTENNITLLYSGESIYNSGINGPYQIRLELRDTNTWSELDVMERYSTEEYSYDEFSAPSISFNETNIEDWGNDTGSDGFDYLDINLSIDSSTSGQTYWINANLEKKSGWNWQHICWEGTEITTDGTDNQLCKIQFDGEKINSKQLNGPYQIRLEIVNTTTWNMIDVIEEYETESYTYDQFQGSSITFDKLDNGNYNISDSGNDTDSDGDYNYLDFDVTINSTSAGTYWLDAGLHKITNGNWQHVAWKGQEVDLDGSGVQVVTVQFDGAQLRNKGINGPYNVRFELNSMSGEWKQYDVTEPAYTTTTAYSYTDFESLGVSLDDMTDGVCDDISNGNLRVNVTVNASSTGTYKVIGDLHKDLGSDWIWISFDETDKQTFSGGEDPVSLIFEGSDISESQVNGPYHVHIELIEVGTEAVIDTIDRYTTGSHSYSEFSGVSGTLNSTGDFINGSDLQVNVSCWSQSSTEYQVSASLHDDNWEFIDWTDNVTTIDGSENITLLFDGSIINNSNLDPAKIFVQLWRTTDNKLMDEGDWDPIWNLNNTYTSNDFSTSVTIGNVTTSVYDSDDDGLNNTLNVTANITFSDGIYKISAGLRDASGNWIAGDYLSETSYNGDEQVNLTFDGVKIRLKNRNGPYTVSYIAVHDRNGKEIAREKNAATTDAYDATDFDEPESNESANLTGTYSSYGLDQTGNGDYEYLIVNVTVEVEETATYDVFGDLFSSSGTSWVTYAKNETQLTAGTSIVQLKFRGDNIYDSAINGPYKLGYVRIGADINISGLETWIILDETTNAHTTSTYTFSQFNSTAPIMADATSIACSNDPFSPNSDGTLDNTLITVNATAGQNLYLNIYNSSMVIKKTGLALSGDSESYTVTWNGKDDNDTVLPDGTYIIKVTDEQTGDQANESNQTQTVVIDTQAPTAVSFVINSGDDYTNTTSVTFTSIAATDNSSIKMRFKNAGGSYTSWQNFDSSKSWNITSSDGLKTVYYEAKDVAGNVIAAAVTETITLDTTKPTVNLSITGKGDTPSTHTDDTSVTLSISASDATSGEEYMMIANTVDFSGSSWVSYNNSKEWSLNSGDGEKTVYIKVKDRAGKISDITSDSITLDTTSPSSLSIQIDSDQSYTNQTNVTLTLSATGAAKMQFKNGTNNWSAWETYSTSKSWSLASGSGTKTVHFRAKDTAGNIATSVNDTITLDTTAPGISSVSSSGISQSQATITWTTDESSTTQVIYSVDTNYGSNTTVNTSRVTSHSQTITGLSSGTTYHYKVKSRDAAGNLRTSADNTFTTSSGGDTTPPNAITGLSASDKINAESTISVSWNESNAPDFAGYYVYRKANASFTDVEATGVSKITTITVRSTTSYEDTSAVDGYTYYYAVTAFDTASPANENTTVSSVSAISYDDKAPVTTIKANGSTITPDWYTEEQPISFVVTDDGKGVNATYYTTDASDPTNTSNQNRTVYSMPFTIGGENTLGDGTYTINYYSDDQNSTPNNETTKTKTINVDTTLPTTTDNAPSGWQNSSVSVTLTSTDNMNGSGVKDTYYTKDGSNPTIASSTYSSPIQFNSDGNHTLKYFTQDNATNQESINTVYVLIDATPPTTIVNTLSTYSSSPVNISWTSSDVTSGIHNITIQYKNGTSGSWIDLNTTQNDSGYQDFNLGADGYTYYFRTVGIDNSSNTETDYDNTGDAYTTIVEHTIYVSIISPSDDDADGRIYVKDNLTITGSVYGLNFSQYWVNYSSDTGSTWTEIDNDTSEIHSSALTIWNTNNVDDGTYTLNLTGVNETGLNNTFTLNVTVDNTDPNITTDPTAGNIDENSAVISWITNESTNATVEYGTTGSYGSTESSPSTFATSHQLSLTGLSDDTTYHYRVISYDRAGNMVNSSDATFTTDEETSSSPPSGPSGPSAAPMPPAGLTAEAGGPYTGTVNIVVEFTGSASSGTEPYSYSWDFDDGSTSTAQNPSHTYSSEGEYEVTLTVNDNDGTTATDTAEVIIEGIPEDDETPSITNIAYSPSTVTDDDTVTISATITDDTEVSTAKLYYSYNGNERSKTLSASGNLYSANIGPFSTGITVQFSLDATDNMGQTTQSGSIRFTVEDSETFTEEEIGNITGDEEVQITPQKSEGTGITDIKIKTKSDIQNAKITISKLDEKPENVLSDAGEYTYMYLDITLKSDDTDVDDADIDSLTVTFKVAQDWFDTNNIDKNKVTLLRYHNNEWQRLSTTMTSEDSSFAYFEATTTGLSTFAITGEQVVDEPSEPTGGFPWLFIILGIIAAIVVAFAVLVKTGYIYFEHEE